MQENLNFGQVVEALKEGKCLSRKGWDNKDTYVYKQYPKDTNNTILNRLRFGVLDGWTPNTLDIFAEDWYIVEQFKQLIYTTMAKKVVKATETKSGGKKC